jgi:hypothetical protein
MPKYRIEARVIFEVEEVNHEEAIAEATFKLNAIDTACFDGKKMQWGWIDRDQGGVTLIEGIEPDDDGE